MVPSAYHVACPNLSYYSISRLTIQKSQPEVMINMKSFPGLCAISAIKIAYKLQLVYFPDFTTAGRYNAECE